MNQLNPDPQGGESNMTDEQIVRQIYPDAIAEKNFVGRWYIYSKSNDRILTSNAKGSEVNAWKDARAKAEGATTQPTKQCTCPQSQWIGSEPNDSTCELSEEEHASLVRDPHDDMDDPASMEGSYRPQFAVPSAGSKPQEEGKYFWHGKPTDSQCFWISCEACPGCNHSCHDKPTAPDGGGAGEEVTEEMDAYGIAEDKQCVCWGTPGCEVCGGSGELPEPTVADGGGLPPRPKLKFNEWRQHEIVFQSFNGTDATTYMDALETANASSQEALRDWQGNYERMKVIALERGERMQQAVEKLRVLEERLSRQMDSNLTDAISLLFPEGSSRSAEKKKEPNDDWNDWDNGGGFDVAGK